MSGGMRGEVGECSIRQPAWAEGLADYVIPRNGERRSSPVIPFLSAVFRMPLSGGKLNTARGAHPVRGKGHAHPTGSIRHREPSFSLTSADSQAIS